MTLQEFKERQLIIDKWTIVLEKIDELQLADSEDGCSYSVPFQNILNIIAEQKKEIIKAQPIVL